VDYLKLDPQLRHRPGPTLAGWIGREVFVFVLQIAAELDMGGFLPDHYLSPDYLAAKWDFDEEARVTMSVTPREFVAKGLAACLRTGLLEQVEGGATLPGWADFYGKALTGAERMAKHRQKNQGVKNPDPVTAVTKSDEPSSRPSHHVTSDATPHHSTPLHRKEEKLLSVRSPDAPAEQLAQADLLRVEPDQPDATPPPPKPSQPSPRTVAVRDAWNAAVRGKMPKVTKWNPAREKATLAALSRYSLDEIRKGFAALAADRFNQGENDRKWVAEFDYAIRPASSQKPEPLLGALERSAGPSNGVDQDEHRARLIAANAKRLAEEEQGGDA